MISISFKKHCDKLISFNIEGHANYDQHGRDIVCSAVSAISGAIVNGITEVLKIEAPYSVNDGFLSLSLKSNTDEEIEKAQVLMETMLISIRSLEINYKEYVNIHVKEV